MLIRQQHLVSAGLSAFTAAAYFHQLYSASAECAMAQTSRAKSGTGGWEAAVAPRQHPYEGMVRACAA